MSDKTETGGVEIPTSNTIIIDGTAWFAINQDFGHVLCFSLKDPQTDEDNAWRGIGYIQNVKTGDTMPLYCIHYVNNSGMCFIQTFAWPFDQKGSELQEHLDDFSKKFPSGSEIKCFKKVTHPYVRVPTEHPTKVQPVSENSTNNNNLIPQPNLDTMPPSSENISDFFQTGISQPIGSSEKWTFVADDKNTTILDNGNTFKNSGGSICWSKGKSQETYSSGKHVAVFKINAAKEYGGQCSNTYIGLYSGSSIFYLAGDGKITGGSFISQKGEGKFKTGDIVTLTFDIDQKTATWQVNDKALITHNFPNDFTSSSPIGVFGQVIQGGDNLSFQQPNSTSNLFSKISQILPTQNGNEIFSKKGAEIKIKGRPWITTQDFGQIVVFNVEKTATDTETKWRGIGYLQNPDTKETIPNYAIHYFNNAKMCFVQTLLYPFEHPKIELDKHIDEFVKVFPPSSTVKFYSTRDDGYSRVPLKNSIPSVPPPPISTIPIPPSFLNLTNGNEIISKLGAQIKISGKPWITTQDFGQILVFNVHKTSPDTTTQWRGYGYIENVSTKEKMPIWCIHYFNNASMCFIQTLDWPFDHSKIELDNHINDFAQKFPDGSDIKFYSIKDEKYTRKPVRPTSSTTPTLLPNLPLIQPTQIVSKSGITIKVSGEPWYTNQNFGQVLVFKVQNAPKDDATQWRGEGYIKNQSTGAKMNIYAIHYMNKGTMCFIQTLSNACNNSRDTLDNNLKDFAKNFPNNSTVEFFATRTDPYVRVLKKDKEITAEGNITIKVKGKPWITTQDFGQILVFNVEKTSHETKTKWRGIGYIENPDTKERMPIWCIHYFNNAEMCFIQTFKWPFDIDKNTLDVNLKLFSKKFPEGSTVKFYSTQDQIYQRIPDRPTDDPSLQRIPNFNKAKEDFMPPWGNGKPIVSKKGARIIVDSKPWITTQDFGQVIVFHIKKGEPHDTATTWKGFGYIENAEFGDRMALFSVHYFNNAEMCFVQTLAVPWEHDKTYLDKHIDTFSRRFPIGTELKFYSLQDLPYVRIPPHTKENFDFFQTGISQPIGSSEKWTFVADDNNTTILDNGNTFKNSGGSICWSKGKSQETYSSGKHVAVFKINAAKEYGGQCSNTYIGLYSGSRNLYLAGDGKVSGATVKQKGEGKFKTGDIVTLTFDIDQKTATWQVNDKALITHNFPNDFTSSSPIGVFGQVIQGGDNLSFHQSGSLPIPSSLPLIYQEPIPPTETGTEIISKKGSSIQISGDPWITTQDFGQVVVFNIHKTSPDTETVWKGYGYIENPTSKERMPIWCIHYFNNSSMCFIQTVEVPWGISQKDLDDHLNIFKQKFPNGSTIKFYALKTLPYTRIPPKTKPDLSTAIQGYDPSLGDHDSWESSSDFSDSYTEDSDSYSNDFFSKTNLDFPAPKENGTEIISKKGAQIQVKGKPWITTQDFGQIVVFNVEKTSHDTETKWRGIGYIENPDTKERMPIWCIHYFNNANMCFIQTIEVPWSNSQKDLDDHLNIFKQKFPSGSFVKFYTLKTVPFTRIPPKTKPDLSSATDDKLAKKIDFATPTQKGTLITTTKISVQGEPWFTHQNFGQIVVFQVSKDVPEDLKNWRGYGYIENVSTKDRMPIWCVHYVNKATMCFIQTLEVPWDYSRDELNDHLTLFKKKFPSGSQVELYSIESGTYQRIPLKSIPTITAKNTPIPKDSQDRYETDFPAPKENGTEIISKKGAQIKISGKPWITTQDFGQIVVFNVQKTEKDTETKWRGIGYIENVSTKERMPIWCVHSFNNANMCFIQTLRFPKGYPKDQLEKHLQIFQKKFPSGTEIKFYSIKDSSYTRLPNDD